MPAFQKLVEGYFGFRRRYLSAASQDFRVETASGQSPKVMMISCSDSRVNPAIITGADMGEIFMVSNVANLVPPYCEDGNTHHSTSAAIEYAVKHLKVEHIIVMGHSSCGGIQALLNDDIQPENNEYSFILPWMDIMKDARDYVRKEHGHRSHDEQICICEKHSLLTSLENLSSFPWVQAGIEGKTLQTHAWFFDIKSGELEEYNAASDSFKALGVSSLESVANRG